MSGAEAGVGISLSSTVVAAGDTVTITGSCSCNRADCNVTFQGLAVLSESTLEYDPPLGQTPCSQRAVTGTREVPGAHQVGVQCHGAAYSPLAIVEVASLEWEPHAEGTVIEPCPNNPGQRIFPDANDPEDTGVGNRRYANAKARVFPVRSGVTVNFKSWDVDDPSSDCGPVDSNGSEGYDNRGQPKEGDLSATSSTTGSDGSTYVVLGVTMQPGDNFRMVASCSSSKLGSMTQAQADAGTAPPHVKLSEMLTVWRRVFIDKDSMGDPPRTPPDRQLFGPITGTSTNLSPVMLQDNTADWRPSNQLTGAVVDPDTGDEVSEAYPVETNLQTSVTCVEGSTLTAHGEPGDPYAIDTDDEDPGDVRDAVKPDHSYTPVYIALVDTYTRHNETSLPFKRNLCFPYGQTGDRDYLNYRQGTSSAMAWMVYLCSSYEGGRSSDGRESDDDPEDEGVTLGLYGSSGKGGPSSSSRRSGTTRRMPARGLSRQRWWRTRWGTSWAGPGTAMKPRA